MFKQIIFLLFVVLLSCNSKPTKKLPVINKMRKTSIDTTHKDPLEGLLDTVGLYKSPIKLISFKIITQQKSKVLRVFYKNVANKSLCAAGFGFLIINSHNKPAKPGNTVSINFDGCGVYEEVKAKESAYFDFTNFKYDNVLTMWPVEVDFMDGKRWALKKDK
jgi:hypothetical protein